MDKGGCGHGSVSGEGEDGGVADGGMGAWGWLGGGPARAGFVGVAQLIGPSVVRVFGLAEGDGTPEGRN